MPFDNNGQFIRVHDWTEDKSNNIPITASRMDAEDDGFADGLSQTLLRNGSVALTGNLKVGSHKITGLADGTANTDAVTLRQLNNISNNVVTLTGDQTIAGTKTFTSSPVVPTVSADDNSTKVATTKWVNTTGNNVVHKTDNETITGNKTFTSNIIDKKSAPAVVLSQSNMSKGDTISNSLVWQTAFTDSTASLNQDHRLGQIATFALPDEGIRTSITAYKNTSGSTNGANISITYPNTGSPYTYAPTPTDTTATDGTQIATTGWVNSTNNNVVHRNGDETIGGNKKFTSDMTISMNTPKLRLSEADVVKGTNPSERKYWSSSFTDSTSSSVSSRLGLIETSLSPQGDTSIEIAAYKNTANSTDSASIKVFYPLTGSPYTYAPTPTVTTSTSSSQIATTGWVNTVGNNIMHLTGTETVAGDKTFTGTLSIAATPILLKQNTALEGGEIRFQKADNDPLSGSPIIDLYNGTIRIVGQDSGNTTRTPFRADINNNRCYASPSDVASTILTTVNKTKDADGYFELGNGLIIQWGRVLVKDVTNKNSITTITFPKAFTTTNFSISGTFEQYTSTQPNNTDDAIFSLTSVSTTNVQGFGYDTGNNSYDAYMRWIAIGY